jgi:flavorubredoxin
MRERSISNSVSLIGVIDWDRRLFDSLIPLPDGTSYNSYLIRGSEKTALLDTVDPDHWSTLEAQLADVPHIDYLVCHHVEQDHSGCIPQVLAKYPDVPVLCSPKAKSMLVEHLAISPDRVVTVDDNEEVSLGDRTLRFLHTPWVHWPETMCTWVPEEGILFSCDFFGSHLATSSIYADDEGVVYEAAKRYYAEIMMAFRNVVARNLVKVEELDIKVIAPSHGPLYPRPALILDAYRDWVGSAPRNVVVIPYISMHGSTKKMVDYLVGALAGKGVRVQQFDMAQADIGKLAVWLVDAATIVVATPTVHGGPHPSIFFATHLANALRPKVRFATVIGSYGWGTRAVEQIAQLIPNLGVQLLDPVLTRGLPTEHTYRDLDHLADQIAERHAGLAV